MKVKALILTLVTLASLGVTVALWFAMNSAQVEYEEVEAVVNSSETITHRGKNGSGTYYTYEVTVNYQDKIYDLNNCHDSYSYVPERTVKVYLYNGKLYANIEGVKTSSPVATLYFVFLFATFGMVLGFPIYLSKQREKSRA